MKEEEEKEEEEVEEWKATMDKILDQDTTQITHGNSPQRSEIEDSEFLEDRNYNNERESKTAIVAQVPSIWTIRRRREFNYQISGEVREFLDVLKNLRLLFDSSFSLSFFLSLSFV